MQADGPWVYWTEGRPEERGRQALLRSPIGGRRPEELLAAPWSARSRVHEYGGGEFLAAGEHVYFVHDADQDVYELTPGTGSAPRRLTREPDQRFADLALDGARHRLIAVSERHGKDAGAPQNLIVAISLDGGARSVTPMIAGRDFYAAPRLSPDGRRLAFMAWDLPGMPWDEAGLYVVDLDQQGVPGKPKLIAGGKGVAASHPAFAPDGTLVFITDESGFGNLAGWDGKTQRALTKLQLECGRPMWSLGHAPFAIDAAGRIWAAPIAKTLSAREGSRVLSIDTRGRNREWHELAEAQLDTLSCGEGGLVAVASSADAAPSIRVYQLGDAYSEMVVRVGSEAALDDVSRPEMVSFKADDGATVRAIYYAPVSGTVSAPRGATPPAIVLAHGGPTSMAGRSLSMRVQFYTSRGFAVLDVDYAGSTGYGRAYRERLDGQWGIADVADCAAAARFLARRGLADPGRIAIAGGSAGGYTVLMALATTQAFAAGASHYGISDLSLLLAHTHKFESGYLHRLMGTTAKSWKTTMRARSPITLVDRISAPVILFQGLEDKVVPPEQSRLIADRLRHKGIAVELHEFAGEAHGFRRAETIIAVLEAELAFLRRAMRIGDA